MFQLDYRDHRPLYEQIKEKIKLLMINGVLKENQQLPSVRELAQALTINPNTIQKAYKDLESEGYLYSIRGKGSFVSPLNHEMNNERKKELLQIIEKAVEELIYIGIPQEQLIGFIHDIYRKGGTHK